MWRCLAETTRLAKKTLRNPGFSFNCCNVNSFFDHTTDTKMFRIEALCRERTLAGRPALSASFVETVVALLRPL